MLLKVFSIYDSAAAFYLTPVFFKTKGEAIRWFTDLAEDPREGNKVAKHAADFHLFYVADFDDSTSAFTPLKVAESLGCALEFARNKSDE